MSNSEWLRATYEKVRELIAAGSTPIINHHQDDDGAVTTILLTGEEDRIKIVWGRGDKKNWK